MKIKIRIPLIFLGIGTSYAQSKIVQQRKIETMKHKLFNWMESMHTQYAELDPN